VKLQRDSCRKDPGQKYCSSKGKVEVFIATDSDRAVRMARLWGKQHESILSVHMQDAQATRGLSRKGGEIAVLGSRTNSRHLLALEILMDISIMMQAQLFVGITGSQLARLVVSVGRVRKTLKGAIAMDHKNIHTIESWKGVAWKFGERDGGLSPKNVLELGSLENFR